MRVAGEETEVRLVVEVDQGDEVGTVEGCLAAERGGVLRLWWGLSVWVLGMERRMATSTAYDFAGRHDHWTIFDI